MAEFKKVASLSEVKGGEVKGISVEGQDIALYRLGKEVFATSDICTHAGCILSENHYLEGEEVECACHGSRFKIKTGENTRPPAAEPLKTYQTKIEGEDILIEV